MHRVRVGSSCMGAQEPHWHPLGLVSAAGCTFHPHIATPLSRDCETQSKLRWQQLLCTLRCDTWGPVPWAPLSYASGWLYAFFSVWTLCLESQRYATTLQPHPLAFSFSEYVCTEAQGSCKCIAGIGTSYNIGILILISHDTCKDNLRSIYMQHFAQLESAI